jgi:hypothetical protein
MSERPLLIFPKCFVSKRGKLKPCFDSSSYHLPDFKSQKDRLTPQFESMLQSFITDSTAGIEPEYVLVIETIGKIEDFKRAVNAIKGLEWLAEIDQDIEPDENFYKKSKIGKRAFSVPIEISAKNSARIWEYIKERNFIDSNGFITEIYYSEKEDIEKTLPDDLCEYKEKIIRVIDEIDSKTREKERLSGRLFLSMSDRQAMEKLLSLQKSWDRPDKSFKRGYTKWKEIFRHIKNIRKWSVEDRIRETGLLDLWKDELEIKKGTSSKISFEIELWYRNDPNSRNQAETNIQRLISEEGGNTIKTCMINEIGFHAIKAKIPTESIQKVIKCEYTQLFKSNDVMFFRPACQSTAGTYPDGETDDYLSGEQPVGEPVVAILDGLPFVNHLLLENRIILDDPDDFEELYKEVKKRKHGTAMASLVCHGELDSNEEPLTRPVYVRPVLSPSEYENRENIPEDVFFEDIIERSVRRIFEGENNDQPAARHIKVINLSICDASKMFFNQLSSCAKLIDWLSEKYQVLFCISAGNVNSNIDLEKDKEQIKKLSDEELVEHTIERINSNIRNSRILCPADSINALTVGAIHTDKSAADNFGNRIDILPNQVSPSPVSAHGHGFRSSVKPEIYMPGGRQLYNYIQSNQYEVDTSGSAPGQKTATAPVNAGERNSYVYTRGTSNAAALTTRGAAQIIEVLEELKIQNKTAFSDENTAVIVKALLVHSASWGSSEKFFNCLKNEKNSRFFRKVISRFLGYGIPDINRVLECTAQRATAIGSGVIKKNEKHEFRFPLPSGLSNSNELRRLIITLAWFSPINPANRKFRKANLSFDPKQNAKIVEVKRKGADWQQVKNGTVQHEIMEGKEITDFQDKDAILIPVVCREDAGALDDQVYYGLTVTLEVAEGVGISVYDEIKERIEIQELIET